MDNVNSHAQRADGGKKRRDGVGVPGGKSVLSAPPLLFLVYMISQI